MNDPLCNLWGIENSNSSFIHDDSGDRLVRDKDLFRFSCLLPGHLYDYCVLQFHIVACLFSQYILWIPKKLIGQWDRNAVILLVCTLPVDYPCINFSASYFKYALSDFFFYFLLSYLEGVDRWISTFSLRSISSEIDKSWEKKQTLNNKN